MEVIFGQLISTIGLPAAMLAFLTLAIVKGWLVPGRFYDDQRDAVAKWEAVSSEQKEINRSLTKAVEDLAHGLGGSATHFFKTLNNQLKRLEAESDEAAKKNTNTDPAEGEDN